MASDGIPRITGADVLEALIALEQRAKRPHDRLVSAYELARELGLNDGRASTPRLKQLERAGLVRRRYATLPYWSTTDRGREVDAILARITVARGGAFVPRSEAGITATETAAL